MYTRACPEVAATRKKSLHCPCGESNPDYLALNLTDLPEECIKML